MLAMIDLKLDELETRNKLAVIWLLGPSSNSVNFAFFFDKVDTCSLKYIYILCHKNDAKHNTFKMFTRCVSSVVSKKYLF